MSPTNVCETSIVGEKFQTWQQHETVRLCLTAVWCDW